MASDRSLCSWDRGRASVTPGICPPAASHSLRNPSRKNLLLSSATAEAEGKTSFSATSRGNEYKWHHFREMKGSHWTGRQVTPKRAALRRSAVINYSVAAPLQRYLFIPLQNHHTVLSVESRKCRGGELRELASVMLPLTAYPSIEV